MTKEYDIEIKELKKDGLDKASFKFTSYKMLDDFLGRFENYSMVVVRRSVTRERKGRFVLRADNKDDRRFYIIWKINGKRIASDEDVQNFYFDHSNFVDEAKVSLKPVKPLNDEQLKEAFERKRDRGELLMLKDAKYGDIEHAEGSPELEEYRKMIGIKK